jgi:phosphonopyruvate decarboxylase
LTAVSKNRAALTGLSFHEALRAEGFNFFVGVPCSLLDPWLGLLPEREKASFVPATNEGEAVALAVGASLTGLRPVVYLQNSGLGNAVNPMTSLATVVGAALLYVIGYRGRAGTSDEPQHLLMGSMTEGLLSSMGCGWTVAEDVDTPHDLLVDASEDLRNGRSHALLFPPGGLIADASLSAEVPRATHPGLPRRVDHLRAAMDAVGTSSSVVVATTGKTGRELDHYAPRPENLCMVGSMGAAPSLALGIALGRPKHPVIVLDGDGALMMRLESLVTIGALKPRNLLHVVIDNNSYETTGGQPTSSSTVDFAAVANSCGYASSATANTAQATHDAVRAFLDGDVRGPHVHVALATSADSPKVGRPRTGPQEQAALLRSALRR